LVGGVDVPSQLMELGLIDEYRIVVTPIIAGEGDGCSKVSTCRRNAN
jgi:dihydrofolate reductase